MDCLLIRQGGIQARLDPVLRSMVGGRWSGTQKRRVYMVDGFAFDSVNYRATTERGDSFAGLPHGMGDFIEVNRVFLA